MNEPAEPENPQDAGQHKHDQCLQDAPLNQLPEAGNEEAANRRQDIACGAGSRTVGHNI